MTRAGMTCAKCGKCHPFSYHQVKCVCGGSLLVRYDMERVAKTFAKPSFYTRTTSMWRYKELLPVSSHEHIVTLGEGWTPLSKLNVESMHLPVKNVWMKREELNPTGSFKARGMSVAVSLLKEQGVKHAAVSSNGNAASALAAYAGCANIEAYVFVPEDCPPLIVQECRGYGANTFRVSGLIQDAGLWVEAGRHLFGWASVSTLKEPGRLEGKKTMGFELAEQLGWRLPTVIIYPTGGGSGIIGMWKAFGELLELGLVSGPLPRMVCVQEEGCAPLAAAKGNYRSTPQPAAATGMRVPHPPDIALLIRIIDETNGTAVAVSRQEITDAQNKLGARGISASPEGAATWAALLQLSRNHWILPDDHVVLFNTAHRLKYEHILEESNPPLDNLNQLFHAKGRG